MTSYNSATVEQDYEGFQQQALRLLQDKSRGDDMFCGLKRLQEEISVLERYIAIDEGDVAGELGDEMLILAAKSQLGVYREIAAMYTTNMATAYELLRIQDEGLTLRSRVEMMIADYAVGHAAGDPMSEMVDLSVELAAYRAVASCYIAEFNATEAILYGDGNFIKRMAQIHQRQSTLLYEQSPTLEHAVRKLAMADALPHEYGTVAQEKVEEPNLPKPEHDTVVHFIHH